MTRATLIYNPVAGRNPARRGAEVRSVAEVLRDTQFELDIRPTEGPGSACDLARAAAAGGAEAVIVFGGDGTINEVVNGLVLSHCPLAILPGGTANIAAKDLGLPHSPVAAARELAAAEPRRIALGRVTWGRAQSARYFLSVAGVGFDAYVVHSLEWGFKRDFGVTAYVWESLRQVWRYGFPPFICRAGGMERRGGMALLQRTERYAGWFHLAPGASLMNERMSLFLFQSGSPWRYFVYSAAVALRRHSELPDLHITENWPLECQPDGAVKPVRVELDGELAGELPATFDLVPEALTLLLPQRLLR